MTLEDKDKSTAVLVLHDEALDSHPFLARLTGTQVQDDGDSEAVVPWTIDNKYYTANISFEPRPTSLAVAGDYPVLLYLFSGQAPNPLPAELTRLVVRDPPPDIALAVRVSELTENAQLGPLDEEVFDELGVEVVDELGGADEDDERPLDALETVRQTLMTHMWPNMVRKPAPGPASRSAPRPEITISSSPPSPPSSSPARQTFPVLFANHTGPPPAQRQRTASDFPTPEPHPDPPSDDEDEGEQAYAQMDDEDGSFGEFAQPSVDEFARLDAWLEDEGDDLAALGRLRALADGAGGFSAAELGDEFGLGPMPSLPPSALPSSSDPLASFDNLYISDPSSSPTNTTSSATRTAPSSAANGTSGTNGGSGFEDDFGPSPATARGSGGSGEPNIPLDPTPLLLHLQNVRAELADVEDEDERRLIAAREVAQLMGQLGFGEGDLGLDELEFDDDL